MAPKAQKQDTTPFEAPPYDAEWVVDAAHDPQSLIDRHNRNAQSPSAAEVYKRAVTEKAETFGVIHVDPATGYRARFKTQGGGQGGGGQESNGSAAGAAAAGRPSGGRGRAREQGGAGGGQGGEDQAARIAELEKQLAAARGGGGDKS